MNLQPSIPTEQLSEETKQLFEVLNKEGDFAVLLIATNFLDACLRSILENKLIDGDTTAKMLDYRGILGTLMARADMCYTLGLIPKPWYLNLIVFARMRNKAAHHRLNMTFSTPEIADLCADLTSPIAEWEEISGRGRFTLCAVMLANQLLGSARHILRQPKTTSPKDPGYVYKRVDCSKADKDEHEP